jgi:hypothetical protein
MAKANESSCIRAATSFGVASMRSKKDQSYQCLLRLASVIVHEAWHFRHGRQEADAYTAQIAFLLGNHASDEQIASVQMARDRVLAADRKPVEATRAPVAIQSAVTAQTSPDRHVERQNRESSL